MADLPKREMSDAKDAEPVVEDPSLPTMTDKPQRPRRIGGKVLQMPEEPSPPRGKANRMKPVPKKPPKKPRGRRGELPDQVAKKTTAQRGVAAEEGDAYVRMRVRVEDGEMSVRSMKTVEGPLIAHEDLHGDLAYEVTVGKKRVASGAIPDVGVNRSFPHPDPVPGQEGHHLAPSAAHEFIARVPREAISLSSLPRTNVTLFRVKEGPLPSVEGPERLVAHFDKELREVAELRGIRLEALPKSVQAQARRSLG
jgi:hypothetical protein